jgi:hypothetical protein
MVSIEAHPVTSMSATTTMPRAGNRRRQIANGRNRTRLGKREAARWTYSCGAFGQEYGQIHR